MKTFKILLLSFLAITLMSASCSADEETTNNSTFTVPEFFRGTYVVELPASRAGEIVVIEEHKITVNGLVIDTGINGATTNTEFNILGRITDFNGVTTTYGTHDVYMSFFTTDGMWLNYVDIDESLDNEIYLVR